MRHETGWFHTHVWWLKTEKDILAAEVSLEEYEVPALYQATQPRAQGQEEKSL